MNEKPLIFHVLNSNKYSGAENVVLSIIDGLSNKYEFVYVTQEGPIIDILKDRGVNYYVIKKMSIEEINQAIKKLKPSLIHAHDFRASVICSHFSKILPVISHLHNNPKWLKSINLYTLLYFFVSRHFCKVLIVSEAIRNEYIFSKYIDYKMINVSNPVSYQKVLSKVDDEMEKKYDLCFVGRLTAQKSPLRLIKIIDDLKKVNNDIKLVMVGDGELREKCLIEIKNRKLENNIEMVLFQKNPFKYISMAKLFILPSQYEGFGLVAFEALTLGLPCFVSKVGGLVDIVDNSCGRLCETDKEFEDAILYTLNNKTIYKKLSFNAKKKSRQLDNLEDYLNKIYDVYQDGILK